MTTLDADIALVRRMLGEGYSIAPDPEGRYVEVGRPSNVDQSEDLHVDADGWRALVDLARKLEAATPAARYRRCTRLLARFREGGHA